MPSATVHRRFAALATRLIDKHGRALQLVTEVNTGTDFDPVLTQSTANVVGVDVQAKSLEVGGSLVATTDKHYLIDSVVSITNDMRVRDGGREYPIIDLGLLAPGMTRILYKVSVGDGTSYTLTITGLSADSTAYMADSTVITADMTEPA